MKSRGRARRFAFTLQPSLVEEAKKTAKAEGVAVNRLINLAVAEKMSTLRTAEYFAERATRGDFKKALRGSTVQARAICPFPATNSPPSPPLSTA